MGAAKCPQCGKKLPGDAHFCAYCGVTLGLATARVPPRDERRVITALFADLAGSTQLGESLDPEDFRDLTGGALALMGAAIEDLGGTVRGTAGDGVLGLFGAPTAHEDDAERAVIAGLRLVDRMRAYSSHAAQRWGVATLRVRVGIETGVAVLGEVHAGSQVQYDASGDCLNTAARLEGAADVNGVLVGPLTHRLIDGAFEWGEPRTLHLKGKARAVLAHHAVAPRGDRLRRGQSAESGSPLVGRNRELTVAGEIVSGVRAGSSRAVFITGQAGIGKTRFMTEVRALFEAPDDAFPSTWLEGTCLSYRAEEPFLPFRQILRQALGRGVDSTSEIRRSLEALVGSGRASEIAPMLGLILGLVPGDDDASRIAALSGESLQLAVIDAFGELILGLASRAPVAIALDDLHWADVTTLRLAEGLIGWLPRDVPVLLILAMRPDSERPSWSLLERIVARAPDRTTDLRLSSLDHEDERTLISELVGEGTLPEDLVSALLARAEGNPFYLRELLRSLQDTGALVEEDGNWAFNAGTTVVVPETVERVVLARIDRLQPVDRDLLNTAAVIGREFDLALLGQIADAALSPDSLSNLTRLGLFEGVGGTEFRFSHPLIQETAYKSMLRRGRAELHGRAADAIEQLTEDHSVEHHAVLARHHRAAGHVLEAARYHRLAAIASQRVHAMAEALHHLDLAVESAASLDTKDASAMLPELYLLRAYSRGRTGDFSGGAADARKSLAGARASRDERLEMKALNELGWLSRVHGYEDSIGHHQQALRIAERLGDLSTQVTALSRMSMIHLNRLRLDEGLELALRAVRIARATEQDQLLGTALDCLKLAALQLGNLERLEDTMAEIIRVQERAGDPYLLQWAYIEGATVPLARGELDQARERIARAVEINQRFVSDRIARAMTLEARSWIDRAAGDPDSAVAAVHQAVEVIGENSTPEWSAWLQASLGSHLIEQGRLAESVAALESALEHSVRVKSPNRALRAASHLAWAYHLLGDDQRARAALEQAQAVLASITAPAGAVFLDGYDSYLAVARTCLALGDVRAAQDLLGPLLAAARHNGWRDVEQSASAVLAAAAG